MSEHGKTIMYYTTETPHKCPRQARRAYTYEPTDFHFSRDLGGADADAEALQAALLGKGRAHPWGLTRAAIVNGMVMAVIIGGAIFFIVK